MELQRGCRRGLRDTAGLSLASCTTPHLPASHADCLLGCMHCRTGGAAAASSTMSDHGAGGATGLLRDDLDDAAAAVGRVELPPAARPALELLLDDLLQVVAVLAGRSQQQRPLHLDDATDERFAGSRAPLHFESCLVGSAVDRHWLHITEFRVQELSCTCYLQYEQQHSNCHLVCSL